MKEYKLWLAKIVTLMLMAFLILPMIAGAFSAAGKLGGPRVAVVELEGPIEDSRDVLKALYNESKDKDTKAIVLRIDSPGGAVAPSEEIYNAVRRLKEVKPIVVSMGSMAASGGLYSALSASKILCQPGTQTGSIGVIMQIPNFSNVADKVGVTMVTVKSGDMKDVGNQFRPMTPEEKKYLEETAHKVHGLFIKAVVDGRKLPEDKVRQFADGRVILGSEAKEIGLVDDFGDVYDAAKEALKLANVTLEPDQMPTLHYSNRKKSFIEKAIDASSSIPAAVGALSSHSSLQYRAF
ncbi:MAG: signal peptide peptidase SppA [Pseudomonadota bacterium]|jgi:protease-4